MQWSVGPPEIAYSTIDGTPFGELLLAANCVHSANPGAPVPNPCNNPFHSGFFTDSGPGFQGALFDFGFATLAPGASMSFRMYFGAAASEDDAEQAVEDVDAQTWSFGQPHTPDGPSWGTPNTFIFAFRSSPPAAPLANDVRLAQIAPATVDGPDQLDVRAELTNIGVQHATNVETDIVLPPALTLVSGSAHHAFGSTLVAGQDVNHTWQVQAPGACLDATHHVTVTATFSDQSGAGPFTRTRTRDLLVRGSCARVVGRVSDRNTGAAITGAYVYACPQTGSGACSAPGVTDARGDYVIGGLASGTYTLTATGPGAYTPDSRAVTLGSYDRPTEDFGLSDRQGPPPGTAVAPTSGTTPDGVPLIARVPMTATEHGCAGASATFTVKSGSIVLASGSMSEAPAGVYASAPFGPFPGATVLTIEIALACPGGLTETTVFNTVYIDPSGTVRRTSGTPIPGATVTLLRADAASGPFMQVPDGDDGVGEIGVVAIGRRHDGGACT